VRKNHTEPFLPNLYLVGFMGTGKTSIGCQVADLLGFKQLDSDKEIEKRQGLSITEIFQKFGEEHFRKLEREFIEKGHPNSGCLVSCGGGLIMQPKMTNTLKEKGIVICLFASLKTILKRINSSSLIHRPLLNVKDQEFRIKKLMDERLPVYLKFGKAVSTENRSIAEVAKHIVRIYKKDSKVNRLIP
jgi:shikimate kinase